MTEAARRIGGFAALVARPGMPSGPSLQRFIAGRPDFPLIERGRKGLPYLIDLDIAEAFVRANWRDGRHCRRVSRAAASPDLQIAIPFPDLET